jgi:hypothetical protein
VPPGPRLRRDGVVDLRCQVSVRDTGLVPGDTSLLLRGSTVDGLRVEGSGTVTTVPAWDRPGNARDLTSNRRVEPCTWRCGARPASLARRRSAPAAGVVVVVVVWETPRP